MENVTTNVFKRRARVGLDILSLEENKPVFVKITAKDVFTSKNYPDGIEYFDVINLETGEASRMWIDGGIRGTLSNLKKDVIGLSLEVMKTGQKTIDMEGEKVKVNTYSIYEIDEPLFK